MASGARQHRHPDHRRRAREEIAQGLDQPIVQRVPLLGPLQGQARDPAIDPNAERRRLRIRVGG
jgi:hypothetical protein